MADQGHGLPVYEDANEAYESNHVAHAVAQLLHVLLALEFRAGRQYDVGVVHRRPVYEDANEAYESNPKKEQFPLYFTQGKSRYRIHAS